MVSYILLLQYADYYDIIILYLVNLIFTFQIVL